MNNAVDKARIMWIYEFFRTFLDMYTRDMTLSYLRT